MKSHQQSKHYGMNAENFFRSLLNKNGLHYTFEDTWFDFMINKKYKVEVKSCQLSVKDGKASVKHYRVGRFDFTKKESREKQFNENIWIALILRNGPDFLLLGFTKAKYLKKKRYIPLTELRKISVIGFQSWFWQVNKK